MTWCEEDAALLATVAPPQNIIFDGHPFIVLKGDTDATWTWLAPAIITGWDMRGADNWLGVGTPIRQLYSEQCVARQVPWDFVLWAVEQRNSPPCMPTKREPLTDAKLAGVRLVVDPLPGREQP